MADPPNTPPNSGSWSQGSSTEGEMSTDRPRSETSGPELIPPAVMGRYRMEHRIGAGGMGVVFAAVDPKLNRKVAIKLMHEHLLDEPKHRIRMLREAQALAQLSHPNVVQIYEVGEDGDHLFIVMEYVDGGTLREWTEARPRSWSEVVGVYAQAAHGLAAAHDVGLTHRDFKPENTLLGRDGRVRVVDFGLAQVQRGASGPESRGPAGTSALFIENAFEMNATITGGVVGTAAYMPPEQLRGLAVDARGDVFAFCVALYRALYGCNPFRGVTVARLYQEITSGHLRPPPEATDVPRWLFDVVARGLASDPARRHPSMHALLAEVEQHAGLAVSMPSAMGRAITPASSRALGDFGYVFDDVVRQRDGVWWWSGRHAESNEGVLARLVPEPRARPELAHRLQQECEALRAVRDPCVAVVDRLLALDDGLALILWTGEGVVLRDLLELREPLDARRRVAITVGVAHALSALHARGRLHGRLTPEHVLVDPASSHVRVFGFEAEAGSETRGPLVDVGVDLRGLGDIAAALLHASSPCSADPLATFRTIVETLRAVDSDTQYQSLRGVRRDLERCLAAFDSEGGGEPFELGAFDVSYDLEIPNILRGRSFELGCLLEAYQRVAASAAEAILVHGPSGIGKTAIVHAFRDEVLRLGGRFIAGKFDPVGSEVPYASLASAIGAWISGLALADAATRGRWAIRIQEALGDNLGVVARVIPELGDLVGVVTLVPSLPASEAAHRFEDSYRRLVAALATPESPIVIFLDDLQWSDRATLKLLGTLLPTLEGANVLLLGTFRDEEVDPDHPLRATLLEWEKQSQVVTMVHVAPLDHPTTAEMIAPVLDLEVSAVAGLAFTLHAKTEGNPLFTWIQLRSLLQQRILRFDGAREAWTWDPAELTEAALGGDVVELMAAAMQRLPQATRETLSVAACVGNMFDLETVAQTLSLESEATAAALEPAIARGVVEVLPPTVAGVTPYRFTHDRMQQAAHALLSDEVEARTHARIGRLMFERMTSEDRDDAIFATVNHLNAGLGAIDDEDERRAILGLNLRAGRRAKLSNAYAEAAVYFRQALTMLPDDRWSPRWADTSFEVYRELMESEYLNQNVEQSRILLAQLLANSRSSIQRAEVYALKATLESSNGHHTRAIELAAAGLRVLGMRIPVRGSTLSVLWDLTAVRRQLRGRSIAELATLPRVEDPAIEVMMKLLIAYGTAGYFVDPRLMSVGMMRITRLTLRHGTTDVSSFGFAGYAMVLSGVLGHYAQAAELGQLALSLNERFKNATLDSKLGVLNGMFLLPWIRPFEQARALLDRAFVSGMRNGDLAYTSYSGATNSTIHMLEGIALDETSAMTEAKLPVVKRTLADDMASIVVTVHRMSLCFRGLTEAPPSFASPDWDEAEFAASLTDARTPLAAYYYRLAKLITKYHFRDLDACEPLVEGIRSRLDAAFGNPTRVDFYFFQMLWAAAVFAKSGLFKRWRLRRIMRSNLRRLARWSTHSPENYESRFLLMSAEFERCTGRRGADPIPLYDRAVRSARRAGAAHLEGLAFELAAEYSALRGHEIAVRRYAEGAIEAYGRWKASAKVALLEQRYPFLSHSLSHPEPQ